MIDQPVAVGPILIVIGVAIGIVLRMLWVLARERRRGDGGSTARSDA